MRIVLFKSHSENIALNWKKKKIEKKHSFDLQQAIIATMAINHFCVIFIA